MALGGAVGVPSHMFLRLPVRASVVRNLTAKHRRVHGDPAIRAELMKKLTGQHSPFTLMGGGLFHLAFGAILTGSAFAKTDG